MPGYILETLFCDAEPAAENATSRDGITETTAVELRFRPIFESGLTDPGTPLRTGAPLHLIEPGRFFLCDRLFDLVTGELDFEPDIARLQRFNGQSPDRAVLDRERNKSIG